MANQMPYVTLTGADGLIELLRTIPEKQLLPAVNKGMRAVGSKTIRAAKGYLKKNHGLDTGQLKKSLGIRKIKTYKKEGRVVMYLGPRRGFGITHPRTKKKHDPFFIGHLVEFGHRIAVDIRTGRAAKNVILPRYRRNGNVYRAPGKLALGKSVGTVQGRPFLRPAVAANQNEFNKQMKQKIIEVLTKARAKKTP